MRPCVGEDFPRSPLRPEVEAKGDLVLLSYLGQLLVDPAAHDFPLPMLIWNKERNDERVADERAGLVGQTRWVEATEGSGDKALLHSRSTSVRPQQGDLLGCRVRRCPSWLPSLYCHDEHGLRC